MLLAIALLVQGVGAIASEMGVASHSRCHASGSSLHGKPAKMPCCHCDECTIPACASGCAMDGATFIVPMSWQPHTIELAAQHVGDASPTVRSSDPRPPLRPPIV
ncbi:MAG TPA: hypothetical protein VFB32_17735 [Rudaea sp.]|nr:hypothetical protein [Rudaea sp.]